MVVYVLLACCAALAVCCVSCHLAKKESTSEAETRRKAEAECIKKAWESFMYHVNKTDLRVEVDGGAYAHISLTGKYKTTPNLTVSHVEHKSERY